MSAQTVRGKRELYAKQLKSQGIRPTRGAANNMLLNNKENIPSVSLLAKRKPAEPTIPRKRVATESTVTQPKRTVPNILRNTSRIIAKRPIATTATKPTTNSTESNNQLRQKKIAELQEKVKKLEKVEAKIKTALIDAQRKLEDKQTKIEAANEKIEKVKEEIQTLQDNKSELAFANKEISARIVELQQDFQNQKDSQALRWEGEQAKFDLLTQTQKTLEKKHAADSDQLALTKQKVSDVDAQISEIEQHIAGKKSQLQASKCTNKDLREKIFELEQIVQSNREQIAHLSEVSQQDESVRRQLQTTILDLKGTIRVFVCAKEAENQSTLSFPDEWRAQSVKLSDDGHSTLFEFDRVFPPATSQKDVFSDLRPLLVNAKEGKQVCIFTYGYAKSGKRSLLFGGDDNQGVLHHALQFALTTKQCKLAASFIEIHEETMRNSLTDADINMITDSSDVQFVGLSPTLIESSSQVNSLLDQVLSQWNSKATNIVQLHFTSKHGKSGDKRTTVCNLVTLPSPSSTVNVSTRSLSKVLNALANAEKNIPYSESKLTALLRHNLTAACKVAFVVTISGESDDVSNTQAILKFATDSNSCSFANHATKKASTNKKPGFRY